MSMEYFEYALRLIHNGKGDFDGAKPESWIRKAEHRLGLQFPPTYRRFLLECGCGDCDGEEVYGIVDDDFDASSVPDAIWVTLAMGESQGLPTQYIIVASVGDGTYCAIDTSQSSLEGSPFVRLSLDNRVIEELAPSFGVYLHDIVADAT